MRTEDGRIIYKCLNGEPEAFGLLVDKYKAGIYAFTYAKLLNFQDAQDVTQDVFEQAYRGLHGLRRWENFVFWLYRIAHNLCKKWLRTMSRRPDREFIEDQDPEILEEPSTAPHRESPMLEVLNEVLESLPETYRQVLTLYYFSNMNSMDIAKALGASPVAIRKRLSRARSELKEGILAMMSSTFEEQRLQARFTFRVMEAVKRIKVQPMNRTASLPWGLAMATGIIIAILSLGSHLNLSHFTKPPMDSMLSDEMAIAETGEIPVDVLKSSQMPIISSKGGDDDGSGIILPDQQNAIPLAPRGKGTVEQIAYSPDGKLLALAGSLGVWLYDASNLNEVGLLEGHTGKVLFVAFSPDGKTLASGSWDDTVRLWDVQTQKQVAILRGHTGVVYSVAFSPDGETLASGSWDRTVRLWNVQGQEQVALLRGHTDWVSSVAFSPDGKTLASGGGDKTVRLWDVQKKKQVGFLQGHAEPVWCVTFSPDGKTLASGGDEEVIRLWDVEKEKQVGLLWGHASWVYSVAFIPDGKTLASGSRDNTVRLWDVAGQKQVGLLQGHTSWVYSVAFSPDGKTLALGSDAVRLWDVEKEKQVGLLEGHTDDMSSVAFSPDGKTLASGGDEKIIRLWDVQEQKQAGVLRGHTDYVCPVAFSPDGKLLASGSWDNTVRLWDVGGQEQVAILRGHINGVQAVAFSPDGKRLASGSGAGAVLLWEANFLTPGRSVEPTEKQLVTWGQVKRTELYQNYPNPFNPDTWIPYQLAQEKNVAIKIYSASGQLVRTLDIGRKPAGPYISKEKAAHWDGRNSSGEQVASDVYFYTIRAGDFAATKKMVVAR
ncbi:sigma-70 family RNA polymerase sigma factor [Candidatus Poribacteria bacterium]